MTAEEVLRWAAAPEAAPAARAHAWIRLRNLPDPGPASHGVAVASTHAALVRLRELGYRSVALLRWSPASWPAGVRAGGGQRLPLDLREAFTRARDYGRAYGDTVTAFEIENEPDISFVEENAETYAAFLKACYLGIRQGAAQWQPAERRRLPAEPWVVMAPLALPPGPYFEQLVRNGLFAYTDAFNYHYYGHAEDFTGVYRQFEGAVAEVSGHGFRGSGNLLRRQEAVREPTVRLQARRLPVLLTEFGYGSLSRRARSTGDGRRRQQQWFADTVRQIERLPVTGAMAFCLTPYVERGNEYGLTLRRGEAAPGSATTLGSTPALESLLESMAHDARHTIDWVVQAGPASPVVLDFLADPRLVQLKRYHGYLTAPSAGSSEGGVAGQVALYNFSGVEIRGKLHCSSVPGLECAIDGAGEITLAPGERRMLPVRVRTVVPGFRRLEVRVAFVPAESRYPAAEFATAFYPDASAMTARVVARFDHDAAAAGRHRRWLARRPLAREEPRLQERGRWRVSDGVDVHESADQTWRFTIAAFPDGEPRPSVAELALPDGFVFPEATMLRFFYRLAAPVTTGPADGRYCDAYFRTARGNLYQVWPRQYATATWSEYTEMRENFSMAFYGRAQLPWRFAGNRPVALVFYFRPMTGPAVYEIRDVRLVELEAAKPAPSVGR